MDSLLVTLTVLCFAFLSGFNAHPSGNYNFVCRDGEEYDMCRSPCEPTCDSIRRIGPRNCSRPCAAGCFCREGYVRGRDNTCIPPEECSRAACPENEEYQQCGSACPLNCTNLHDGIFCTKPCRKGCFCKPDYVRNVEGKCVDPRTCGVVGNHRCPKNEVYVNCVNRCNTCWEDPYCRITSCSFGCDCLPGYFRNSHGKCVTEEQCNYEVQPHCGVNEVYTDCVNPCKQCSSERCYEPYYSCTPGCDCEQGFLRNDRGVCVLEQECFAPACAENEIYLQCGPSCRSTCGNYRSLLSHPCKEECVSGCFCRGNYVIGPTGKCIKLQACPVTTHSCPKGQVFYQCLPTCRKTCQSLSSFNEVCTMECKPGCFCHPGKVLNGSGICVLPSECPVQSYPPCKPGEAYYNCMPCQNTCDNPNVMCTQDCRPGCACEKGKILRRDGNCVEPSACRIVCGANEEFLSCGSACPLTCESLENPRGSCSSRCVRGCFCKTGFMLGPNEKCIPRQNCITEAGSGIDGRGGPTKSNVSTSTPVSPTKSTQKVTSEPSNSSDSNSTDRTTTPLSVTTAPSVENATMTLGEENATMTPAVENATIVRTPPAVENATNATTAPSVTNSTAAPTPTNTTVSQIATNATTAPNATLETAPPKSETTSLPSTENATPVVTTQTSETSSAVSIETTEMVTSPSFVNTTSNKKIE